MVVYAFNLVLLRLLGFLVITVIVFEILVTELSENHSGLVIHNDVGLQNVLLLNALRALLIVIC